MRRVRSITDIYSVVLPHLYSTTLEAIIVLLEIIVIIAIFSKITIIACNASMELL